MVISGNQHKKCPLYVEINARFDLDADSEKTLPVATLAEFLTEQNIEAIVEPLDEVLVEDFCSEKHATGNGDERFQRRGTKSRSAMTTAGQHDFSLHYVEVTAADHNEESYFRPVEDKFDFDGQKQYQQDISFQCADRATTLSYREAAGHGDGFVSMLSPARSTAVSRPTAASSPSSSPTFSRKSKPTLSSPIARSATVRT